MTEREENIWNTLFRGKAHALNGEWVKGRYYTKTTYTNHTSTHDYFLGMTSSTDDIINIDEIRQSPETEEAMEDYYEPFGLGEDEWDDDYTVFPETLGVSSTLKDGKGNEIFSDDILKVSFLSKSKVFGVVKYAKGVFYIEEFGNDTQQPSAPLYSMLERSEYQWEVCGNVFDNPELLPENHPLREVSAKFKAKIEQRKKEYDNFMQREPDAQFPECEKAELPF